MVQKNGYVADYNQFSNYNNNIGYQKKVDEDKGIGLQIYIFCPMLNEGIMFYDDSQKANGSEMQSSFICDGATKVVWDEQINGKRDSHWQSEVDSENSLLVNSVLHDLMTNTGKVTYNARTLVVSERVFVKVLNQLKQQDAYKHIDLGTRIKNILNRYDYDNAITDTYNDINGITDGYNNESGGIKFK